MKQLTITILFFLLLIVLRDSAKSQNGAEAPINTDKPEVWMAPNVSVAHSGKSVGKSKPGYIRQEIPEFKIPAYEGERYTDKVPDTLDLAERAKLAIQGMTKTTDPDLDHQIYFIAFFLSNPPVMTHCFADVVETKYFEAMPLLRTMTGSDFNAHVDRAWMTSILKSIGPDGLYYFCTDGRLWMQGGKDMYDWAPTVLWEDGSITSCGARTIRYFAEKWSYGRIIGAMTAYRLRDGNPIWDEIIRRMIDRFGQLMTEKENYGYLPAVLLTPNAKKPADVDPSSGLQASETCRSLILGLAQYYKATGYKPALPMAGKLARFELRQVKFFGEDGSFAEQSHFHSHSIALLSLLEYGLAAKDHEVVTAVKKSYEWARTPAARSSTLIGWFPEAEIDKHPVCETCCIADMIALALKLSRAGEGDYWDDADRWLRNQFAEAQLTDVDWIAPWAEKQKKRALVDTETSDSVVQRTRGAFLAYTTGNDRTMDYSTGMAACCVGNAARALYYAWESILDFKDGELKINLLLNRASQWADVYSSIPYEGRVDLRIKQPLDNVALRVPEWIEAGSDKVICSINGKPHSITWQVRYVNCGAMKKDDKVIVRFPINMRTVSNERIGTGVYQYTVKGNTVIAVEPRGKYNSLYQRDDYRADKAPWVERERFVPKKQIDW